MPLLDLTVDLELDGPQQGWTDVTRDVLVRGGVAWDYGLPGPMPADRVDEIGECRYQLDNSAANRAGIAGYYAPGHPAARPGFDQGIACRISLAHGDTVRRKLYYLDRVVCEKSADRNPPAESRLRPMPGSLNGRRMAPPGSPRTCRIAEMSLVSYRCT